MKETASDGVPTRGTAKNPLMKELVETSPEIPPAVARQREEEEEEEEKERAKYVQTIIDCGKKLKQHMTEEERVKKEWRMKSEERVDRGITTAIDSLQQKRTQVLQLNLRRKRRIGQLLNEIQIEMDRAVHEVSPDRELEEEMLQFEEEQQQLREQQQLEEAQEAQTQEAQTQEGQGDTSV